MVGRGRGLSQVTSASSPQTPWYCSAAIGAVLPASWCYPGPAAPHPPVYSGTSVDDAIAAGVAATQQQNQDFFNALSENLPGMDNTGAIDPAAYATSGKQTQQATAAVQTDYMPSLLLGGGVLVVVLMLARKK